VNLSSNFYKIHINLQINNKSIKFIKKIIVEKIIRSILKKIKISYFPLQDGLRFLFLSEIALIKENRIQKGWGKLESTK
jgi:hypothetical protein